MVDRLLMVLEVLLLIWVVVQGEYVRYYEREVFRMNKERFEERARWREQKRQQQTKKDAGLKTSTSNANLESPSPNEKPESKSKTISVPSVADLSTLTDIPAPTISISK